MRRLLDRRRSRDERGFTIVEVTLTLLILSIVLMVAFEFLDRASIMTYRADAHASAEDATQKVLRTVTQNLRGAHPIGAACTTDGLSPALPTSYGDCVRFTVRRTESGIDTCARTEFVYALVGTAPNRTLIQRRQEYTGTTTTTCTPGPAGNRLVLLQKVANTTTQPLFSYYAGNGTAIATSSAAAVQAASSVKVTLAVTFRTAAQPLVLTSSAALRNNVTR